jgi:hypothetical protein
MSFDRPPVPAHLHACEDASESGVTFPHVLVVRVPMNGVDHPSRGVWPAEEGEILGRPFFLAAALRCGIVIRDAVGETHLLLCRRRGSRHPAPSVFVSTR